MYETCVRVVSQFVSGVSQCQCRHPPCGACVRCDEAEPVLAGGGGGMRVREGNARGAPIGAR
eukprot:scaffold7068_cov75-Isochrysis_galbana.AAC.1